ncbi:hypothetical protein EXIGUO8H_380008 [Exiguobacterium sp. 8H]|nr:hypothetical protein EXIGUO8H_380008 [Exiguobacterium sp. 8H]VXB98447.1 hypothetical protein EXIGUO8A_460002 [Exiguobacterium sp. 8A]
MSRSGYYAWLNRAEAESLREERDYLDATLLKKIHDSHKGKVGYRGLLHGGARNPRVPNQP